MGLLNIGEEEGKGNLLTQATYPLLKSNPLFNFIGNVEGRDIFSEKADVVVCEGFTGNVILKMAESIHDMTSRRHIHDEYFDRFDFEQYGGVPVLGVAKARYYWSWHLPWAIIQKYDFYGATDNRKRPAGQNQSQFRHFNFQCLRHQYIFFPFRCFEFH